MYKPEEKNKYNLTIKDIKKLVIGDRTLIKPPIFWRNDVIDAWCCSGSVGNSNYGDETEFWMGFYDIDAKAYANKFRVSFSTYGGMCGYNFNKFYQLEDVDCDNDIKIQELFLKKINLFIENGILKRSNAL